MKSDKRVVAFFGFEKYEGPKYRIISNGKINDVEERTFDGLGDIRWEYVEDDEVESVINMLGNELHSGEIILIRKDKSKEETKCDKFKDKSEE